MRLWGMTTHLTAHERLRAGADFPDVDLLDHAGNRRRLSDLVAGVAVTTRSCTTRSRSVVTPR